jgi:EmrB/QacA subfamily drug resistance transporter
VTTASAPAQLVLPRLSSQKGRWIIAATALGSGMVFLDSSVVNVALPRIQSDLGVPLSGLQWVIDSYALFLAALLLVGGAIGDAYGRKRAFLIGLIIFTLSSIACGLAPNAGVLIGARAVQGIGGAFLVPGSLAMIKATIASEDSGRAIGLWAGLSGATTAFGPLIGGYFVGSVSWRLIFFINVPLAALTIYATLIHVPETKDTRASKRLDWPGAAATVIGLGGVTFGLIQGPGSGWTSAPVLVTLIVGSVALVLFPFIEMQSPNPMVPLRLFRSSNFTGSNLATLGVYFSFNGAFLFLVLKLQQVQGYSPLEAGASLVPVTLLLLLLSPRIGGLIGRFGARMLMTSGAGIIAAGFLLLSLLGRAAPYWSELLPSIVVLGLGMCLFITPLTATVMGSVPPDSVGVASGVNNAVSRVAGLLAVAVLGVVVVTEFQSSLSARISSAGLSTQARSSLISHATRLADDPIPAQLSPPKRRFVQIAIKDAYVTGYRLAMLTCMVLCLLSAVVSALMIRPDPVSLKVEG